MLPKSLDFYVKEVTYYNSFRDYADLSSKLFQGDPTGLPEITQIHSRVHTHPGENPEHKGLSGIHQAIYRFRLFSDA